MASGASPIARSTNSPTAPRTGSPRSGFRRGDALALMSANNAEFLATYFACAKLGVDLRADQPVLAQQGARLCSGARRGRRASWSRRHLLEQLRPALDEAACVKEIVVIGALRTGPRSRPPDAELRRAAERGRRDEPEAFVEDRDPISYLYTSGTTSAPKGVVSSHLAIYLESLGVALDTRMTAAGPRHGPDAPVPHRAAQRLRDAGDRGRRRDLHPARLRRQPRCSTSSRPSASPSLRAADDVSRHARASRPARRAKSPACASRSTRWRRCRPTNCSNAMATFGCDFSLMFGQTEMNPLAVYFRPEHQLSHPGAVGTPSPERPGRDHGRERPRAARRASRARSSIAARRS